MAKKKTHRKKKIGARAGAAMHRAGGKALGKHHRAKKKARGHARMHALAGAALAAHAKKARKGKGKKKARKGGKRKRFKTKAQIGRTKAALSCPTGTTLVTAGVASKSKSGRKTTRLVAACVGGRLVRR